MSRKSRALAGLQPGEWISWANDPPMSAKELRKAERAANVIRRLAGKKEIKIRTGGIGVVITCK